MREDLLNFIKGLGIGAVNIIPGASGGTMAAIFGIFEKLTEAVSRFWTASLREKIKYLRFLAPVGIGTLVGIVTFSNIITWFLTHHPRITAVVFILIMLPSLPLIVKGLEKKDKKNIFFFFLGILITLVFVILDMKYGSKTAGTGIQVAVTAGYCLKIFLCGMIAAGTMLIPGISGSLMLLILGEYHRVIGFVSDFKNMPQYLKNFTSFSEIIRELHLIPLSLFTVGAILGLLFVAKLLNYLLRKYKGPSLFFITGLVIVSLLQIWLKLS
jgi:putative membrane protein